MPKIKTHRGAAKRFAKTANGFKRKYAFKRHILTKKSAKTIRKLRAGTQIAECDKKSVQKMLPYAWRRVESFQIDSVQL